MQEEKVSRSACFLTLTYDTATVPITDKGFMNLQKRDIQLFMKRLRKSNEHKLKYYLCGEYGGKTFRPHYHALLFNAELPTIQPAWPLGSIHYGSVTGASVGYTLKYMAKPSRIPLHKNDDRQKEFSLMSKGLGSNYLTPAMKKYHLSDLLNRMYCNLEDGKKISMPRYYKNKIYEEQQRQAIGWSIRKRMDIETADLLKNPNHFRDLSEAHLQAFRLFAKNASKIERNQI